MSGCISSLKNDFRPGGNVNTPEELFGWNSPQLGDEHSKLDNAILDINSGASLIIRGERRSGKTSFLKCLMRRVKNEMSEVTPVEVDFYTYRPQSPEEAFKFILKRVLKALKKRKDLDWSAETVEELEDLADLEAIHAQGLDPVEIFKEALMELSEKLEDERHILLLFFDEFEQVLHAFGEDSQHFSLFRTCQEKSGGPQGIHCVLAGALSVEAHSNKDVSNLFNTFTGHYYLTRIEKSEFLRMWDYHLERCSEVIRLCVEKGLEQSGGREELYALCGGRPAYAKMLADSWGKSEYASIPNGLEKWFHEILNRQPDADKNILFRLAEMQEGEHSEKLYSKDLNELGLIEEKEGYYTLSGGLWKEYLKRARHNYVANDGIQTITDGLDLARWFLKHENFSIDILPHLSGESHWLEYKASVFVKKEELFRQKEFDFELAKAVLSLANSGGGALLIGVDDKGFPVPLGPRYEKNPSQQFNDFAEVNLRSRLLPTHAKWKYKDEDKNQIEWELLPTDRQKYNNLKDAIAFHKLKNSNEHFIAFVPKVDEPIQLVLTCNGNVPDVKMPSRRLDVGKVKMCDAAEALTYRKEYFTPKRYRENAEDCLQLLKKERS